MKDRVGGWEFGVKEGCHILLPSINVVFELPLLSIIKKALIKHIR